MRGKFSSLIAVAVSSALTVPASAAVKYYVYHEPASQQCTVVKGSPLMMYGISYDTRAEAEAALKADKTCK